MEVIEPKKIDFSINEKIEIGKVTEEEKNEIKSLFERKNGFLELAKYMLYISKEEIDNSYLYENLIIEVGKSSISLQDWWERMSTKYKWITKSGCSWEIDFDSCKIYIKK